MHICVKSVRVSFLVLRHLRPGNLQWGWLACTANTRVLLVLLLLDPLLLNHWLLLDLTDSLPRGTRLLNTTKTIIKYCLDARLWIFVVSKASGRSLFDHFQTVYIRIYTEKPYIYAG